MADWVDDMADPDSGNYDESGRHKLDALHGRRIDRQGSSGGLLSWLGCAVLTPVLITALVGGPVVLVGAVVRLALRMW